MDAEARKKLVREFLELLQTGQTDAALALTTGNPDLLVFNNPIPGGARALSQMVKAMFTDGPYRTFDAQYVDGDTVISQLTITGTTAKGGEYKNHYLIICKLKGDKVDHMQEYMDSAYANKAFGMG